MSVRLLMLQQRLQLQLLLVLLLLVLQGRVVSQELLALIHEGPLTGSPAHAGQGVRATASVPAAQGAAAPVLPSKGGGAAAAAATTTGSAAAATVSRSGILGSQRHERDLGL